MKAENLRRILVTSAIAWGIPAALALPVVSHAAPVKPQPTPCLLDCQNTAPVTPLPSL
jgi:hypothetical protein